jgi:hypothetical protein
MAVEISQVRIRKNGLAAARHATIIEEKQRTERSPTQLHKSSILPKTSDYLSTFINFIAPSFKNPEEFMYGAREMEKDIRESDGYTGQFNRQTFMEIITEAQHTPRPSRKMDFVEDVIEHKGGLEFFADLRTLKIDALPEDETRSISSERKLGRQLVKMARERQQEADMNLSLSPTLIKLTQNEPYNLGNRNSMAS